MSSFLLAFRSCGYFVRLSLFFLFDPGESFEHVAIVGFDDSSAALQSSPQLTTMTNPASELTRRAAEMLKQLLDGAPSPEPVILPSRLVVRDSA